MLTERFSRYFQKWTTVDLFQEQVNSYLPQSVSVLHTKSKQWLIVSLSPFYTCFASYIQVSEHGDQNK